jgi:hypothetical protein
MMCLGAFNVAVTCGARRVRRDYCIIVGGILEAMIETEREEKGREGGKAEPVSDVASRRTPKHCALGQSVIGPLYH